MADGVLVRRHRSFDLNVGLVLGDGACLVIDTRAGEAQARDLIAAVRAVTSTPWTVVNTHDHFDHCFGNAALLPAPIWGHRRCAANLGTYGEVQRALAVRMARESGKEDLAVDLEGVRIVLPAHLVDQQAELAVGGRQVELLHLGRGHTDNDLVVRVPDAGVVFAGDLIEESGPLQFHDAFPLEWPGTLARLLPLLTGPVVPGHGDVVDRAFVETQRDLLERVADAAQRASAHEESTEALAARLPLPGSVGGVAAARALGQLRGEPDLDLPEEILRRAGLGG